MEPSGTAITETENEYTKVDAFACCCGDKSKEEMRLLKEWAYDNIGIANNQVGAGIVTTRLLYALADYRLTVGDILLDQWGGMTIKTGNKLAKPLHIWMQFDRFEDGLMLAYQIAYNFYEKGEVPVKND